MRWWEMLQTGKAKTVKEVGELEGVSPGYVSILLPYALMAPDIVKAIIKGEHPPELSANALLYKNELPKVWEEQKRVLNFG